MVEFLLVEGRLRSLGDLDIDRSWALGELLLGDGCLLLLDELLALGDLGGCGRLRIHTDDLVR